MATQFNMRSSCGTLDSKPPPEHLLRRTSNNSLAIGSRKLLKLFPSCGGPRNSWFRLMA